MEDSHVCTRSPDPTPTLRCRGGLGVRGCSSAQVGWAVSGGVDGVFQPLSCGSSHLGNTVAVDSADIDE